MSCMIHENFCFRLSCSVYETVDPIHAFVASTTCCVTAKKMLSPALVTKKVSPQSLIGFVIISLMMRVAGFKWAFELLTWDRSLGRVWFESVSTSSERSSEEETTNVPPPPNVCWFLRTKGSRCLEIWDMVWAMWALSHWPRGPEQSEGIDRFVWFDVHTSQQELGVGLMPSSSSNKDRGLRDSISN